MCQMQVLYLSQDSRGNQINQPTMKHKEKTTSPRSMFALSSSIRKGHPRASIILGCAMSLWHFVDVAKAHISLTGIGTSRCLGGGRGEVRQ